MRPLVLLVAAAYLQLTRRRSERIAREAREQTRDILQTVKEGFFLLDADYRIGAVWSSALARMFGRQDFAGLSFEELLEDRVPPATLATATKYIKLLWGDRAHENLMKSINPLGQVEIQVDDGRGGRDTRYLQFDFHRVMGEQGVKHVLVSVSDVTANVLLARELARVAAERQPAGRHDAGRHAARPGAAHLASSTRRTRACSHVNSIMKEPARDDAEFRRKLDKLFRELHAVKGEASALNLMSAAQRVHALEDMVGELKQQPSALRQPLPAAAAEARRADVAPAEPARAGDAPRRDAGRGAPAAGAPALRRRAARGRRPARRANEISSDAQRAGGPAVHRASARASSSR